MRSITFDYAPQLKTQIEVRNNEARRQQNDARRAEKASQTPTEAKHARDIAAAKNGQLMMRLFTENKPEYDRLCRVLRQDRQDRERTQNLRAR